MYTVYILQSLKTAGYYIGHCQVLPVRLKQHNAGKVRSTQHDCPWKVVRTEVFTTKREAYARERQIKSYKGGAAFKRLLTVPPAGGMSADSLHKSTGLAPSEVLPLI